MDMNENNWQGQQYQFEQPLRHKANSMATAANILGIATIVTTIMCTVYLPFITGGLAILFAILSKGSARQMSRPAKTGVTAGIIGLAMNILLIAMVWIVYTTNPEIHQQVNDIFEQRYGITIDEMIDELSQ